MKAIVRKVSEVDSSGNIEIAYEIFDGSKSIARQTYQGEAQFMEQVIKNKLADLKTAREQAGLIKVGDEIVL